MAKLVIKFGKQDILLSISENTAQHLSEDERGILGIENFLGTEYLNNIGYSKVPYGQKRLSIYTDKGKLMFSSVA